MKIKDITFECRNEEYNIFTIWFPTDEEHYWFGYIIGEMYYGDPRYGTEELYFRVKDRANSDIDYKLLPNHYIDNEVFKCIEKEFKELALKENLIDYL